MTPSASKRVMYIRLGDQGGKAGLQTRFVNHWLAIQLDKQALQSTDLKCKLANLVCKSTFQSYFIMQDLKAPLGNLALKCYFENHN